VSTSGRTTVGRYELRRRLGVGGMGTVWHAWDPALRRDVAVKEVALPSGMGPEDRAEAFARTLREAQATARISHTAVVTIHDVLDHDASPWIVMELLSGSSLQQHLDAGGPLPVGRVEQAARSLLGGLGAAHAVGVAHRDVKPANIMLTGDDRTVLTDFGIANVDGSAALTQAGVFIGSPEYMAPERFEGERALPASDLWSLGVTLYSLLEGRSPFKRDSVTGIISAVLTAPVPPQLSRSEPADAPEILALRALIGALLNRDAAARPSPQQALDLLERRRLAPRRHVGTLPGPLPNTGPPCGAEGAGGAGAGGRGGDRAAESDVSARFVRGIGHTGTTGPEPSAAPARARRVPPGTDRPASVLTAMVMLGLNALVLFALTAVSAGQADSPTGTTWVNVVVLGSWGALSALASFGLLTRSRLVFALVVLAQGLAAVSLAVSMFAVFVHTPELLAVYALMLLYTLAIGGLLLLPGRSRAYFGLG
jgi:hypothetical protein